jgi:hypothetical protein
MSKDVHLNERELLMAVDDELSSRYIANIRSHLAVCQQCRARKSGLEGVLEDLHAAHRATLDARLPASSAPHAMLKARLAEAAAQETPARLWWRFLQTGSVMRAAMAICVVGLLAVTAARFLFPHSILRNANANAVEFDHAAIPNSKLTPGATRRVSLGEVCTMAHEDVEREVPGSLREQVFREYGIAGARAEDYEIDYLIAPGLGGTEDIHNLWPEPYTSEAWNAHVKDALEEHLHQLVCTGKVDLRTAQNDISTDWIAAYKKYFQTDKPVGVTVVSEEKDLRLPRFVVVRADRKDHDKHFPT